MRGESAISSPASPVNPSNSITPSPTTTAPASFEGPTTAVPSRSLRPRSTAKPVNEPSNIMQHTAKAGIPLPLSYTPTTHRISKAKKGKRVHACEFPGCHKVFTRAEHRRRHELNHNPEARFCCNHSGCQRTFHRQDLLTRHIERHELEKQVENETCWKQSVQLPPIESTPPITTKNVPMGSDMFFPATTQQQQPPNSMCIESLITPEIQLEDQPMAWAGLDFPSSSSSSSSSSHSRSSSALQGHVPESNEDSLFYSYPESCASSTSDGATFSLASQARSSISSTPPTVLDQYPDRVLDAELMSSPMPMRAELQCWDPAGADMSSSHMLPFSLEGGFSHPQPSFQPSPSWQLPYEEHNPLQSTFDTWSL